MSDHHRHLQQYCCCHGSPTGSFTRASVTSTAKSAMHSHRVVWTSLEPVVRVHVRLSIPMSPKGRYDIAVIGAGGSLARAAITRGMA